MLWAATAGAATAPANDAATAAAPWVHAYSAYGTPKYPRGFDHFDYADPNAVKGGTLYLNQPDRRTSFDKYNPFTIKGNAPGGLFVFMFETLAIPSGDEPGTVYGLLAEEMQVAQDRSAVSFRLNPKARFNNGDPVLAADVKHSFEMLTGKYASPQYRTPLSAVSRAEVLDERTIRFELKDRSVDAVLQIADMRVFSRKWGVGPDGKAKPFDQVVNDEPITSGPYRIALADSGRRLELERRPDYWARDLGVRRGFFNFDRVVYRYYQDRAISMEAFKAGEFDLLLEYSASRWDRVHAGPKWRDGRIKKELLVHQKGEGQQAYLFNLRRPLFQDRRVREAIDLAYDFDWVNRRRQYKRNESVFANSEFAATGLPSAGELKLLEPYRAELPPEVFGPPYQAPRTDSGPMALRENLRRARDLLAAAGYKLGSDGVLVNDAGQRLEFEYLTSEDGAARTAAVWISHMEKLGIRMKVRRVDFALFRKRLEVFDYDMVAIVLPDFTLPSPLDYTEIFGSKSADEQASGNYRGVKSRAVDAVLEAMNRATTMPDLLDAAHALDRIVMHERWQVPELYANNYRVSYWDRFERPKTVPKYFTIESPNESLPQWPITTWWLKPGVSPTH
ncbi:extracellular solute-binding protein [Caldimonas sp. KR1-144]|uniref:extracellular solute-binding protein n=1 Tax=Caldimonas sp. KR1-144 TaxID=3400911 RepID=UPI003C0E9102